VFFRQTPENDGVWREIRFVCGISDDEPDWLLSYDEPEDTVRTRVPVARRILFVTEPVKDYRPHYLRQFGVVVSPRRLDGFNGIWIQRHASLPWHFGIDKSQSHWEQQATLFSELTALRPEEKRFDLSIICSNLTRLPEHRRRLAFAEALKGLLGDRLHWYGSGIRDMADKAEAIVPYRYHVALENNTIDHFWTEKIADAYLGRTFPFYWGCPNLDAYFSTGAFARIDIGDPEGAARIIETAIANRLFEKRATEMEDARRKVLFEYNLFNEVRNLILKLEGGDADPLRLRFRRTIYPVKKGPRAWLDIRRRSVAKKLRLRPLLRAED
jgi:hypothetical protein